MSLRLVLLLFFISISQISANTGFTSSKHLVFSLAGSFHGYGDFTGPFWTMLEMIDFYPNDHFTAIIDERSETILKELFDGESLESLERRLKVQFVMQDQTDQMEKADYSFELFFGGRVVTHLSDPVYTDDNTITIISDTMHGSRLDEIRRGKSHIYFKPPGIGDNRSGLLTNPDVAWLQGKSPKQRREDVANLFKDSPLEKWLQSELSSNAKISFIYGVHNELQKKELAGQTEKFVQLLKTQSSIHSPIFIFTPNSKEDLEKTLSKSVRILSEKDLSHPKFLENTIYLVSMGKLSSIKFTGLLAISDMPVLIEGNSTVSSAIRLHVPFLIYRSPWNDIFLNDLIQLESKYYSSTLFKDIYRPLRDDGELSHPVGMVPTPNIEEAAPLLSLEGEINENRLPAFENIFSQKEKHLIFKTLSSNIQGFSKKLALIVNSMEMIKKIEKKLSNANHLDSEYLNLINEIELTTRDEILGYSLTIDAYIRKLISESVFEEKVADLRKKGVDIEQLTLKLIPNEANFSEKFEFFQGMKSPSLKIRLQNASMEQEIKKSKSELQLHQSRDLSADPLVQDYLKNHKVYISMTTIPKRISRIHHTIETLDTTNIEEILINLPQTFSRDGTQYNKRSKFLKNHPKIKILSTPVDWGPITKLTGAVEYVKSKDPQSIIITIDDDIGYPKGMVNELIYESVHHLDSVVGSSGQPSEYWNIDRFFPFVSANQMYSSSQSIPRTNQVDVIEGFAGVAYIAEQVDSELMNTLSLSSPSCFVSDDLVISFVLAMGNRPRVMFESEYFNRNMVRSYPYGFNEDALHRGAGLSGMLFDPGHHIDHINRQKYQVCHQHMLEYCQAHLNCI